MKRVLFSLLMVFSSWSYAEIQHKNNHSSDPQDELTTSQSPSEESTNDSVSDDPAVQSMEKDKKRLETESLLKRAKLRHEHAELLSRLQALRWEKEVLTEELEIQKLKKEATDKDKTAEYEEKLSQLKRDSELAALNEAKLSSELKMLQSEWELKNAHIQAEIKAFKVEKERKAYADKQPVYKAAPFINGNTLIISDRRIDMNGPILPETAEHISKQINYFNNKNTDYPIFLVIDGSPGGSVMAGYQIIKSIQSSKAPVYVVVKSYAASMAAIITAMAENSFAYPNTIFVHHQPVATLFLAQLNLTEQKEFYETSKEWWNRIMEPVAKKMGITGEEFIKQMYENSSNGNWTEFATEGAKLNWVNTLVDHIHDTSLVQKPLLPGEEEPLVNPLISASIDPDTLQNIMMLPRLYPKDIYFLHNPDGYYRIK